MSRSPNVIDRTRILMESYAWTVAIDAARDLGIFDQLEAAPASAAEVAGALGLDARGVAIVLHALEFAGAVTRDGDRKYTLEPMTAIIADHWRGLEARLRHGQPTTRFDSCEGAVAVYPGIVAALGDRARDAARLAAAHLAAPGLAVLDLGAGAAPWSLAILDREPTCRITAVELNGVIAETARAVLACGRRDAFELREGDAFTIELEAERFDLVIIAGFCHLFGEDVNRALVRRARRALRPHGRMAIIDVVPEDEPDQRVLNLYRLSLLLRTCEGQVYPFSSFASWMSEAGLVDIDRRPLSGVPRPSLLLGRRPP